MNFFNAVNPLATTATRLTLRVISSSITEAQSELLTKAEDLLGANFDIAINKIEVVEQEDGSFLFIGEVMAVQKADHG